jgi:hypothetical protein
MAMARYEERGNLLGVSRCWNNLSDIASSENHIPDAIDLARKALAIRIRIGDVDGEILNLSNLSLAANEPAQAESVRKTMHRRGRAPPALTTAGSRLVRAHTCKRPARPPRRGQGRH